VFIKEIQFLKNKNYFSSTNLSPKTSHEGLHHRGYTSWISTVEVERPSGEVEETITGKNIEQVMAERHC
jgi:hypothetical protein